MRSPIVFGLLLAFTLACAPPAGTDAGVADASGPGVDSGPPETGYPAPRDDLVPSVGRADAIELATWNIENFPQSEDTPRFVADLITSLGLDLIAVQEIAGLSAFEELVTRLPYHESVISSHSYSDGSYQKIGFIYRADLLEVTDVTQLFSGAGYEFPRPPLQARVSVIGADVDFTIISVHLKAGIGFEDRERRTSAVTSLVGHIQGMIDGPADDDVVLLGDFNEVVTTAAGQGVFGDLLDDPFRLHTVPLAENGLTTYLPSGAILDHVVTTASLDDELTGGGGAEVPRLDAEMTTYWGAVSDHLPVVVHMPVLP
jgi:endonuclease/exonuclease/phosphatase family metal-dependent hydrolase